MASGKILTGSKAEVQAIGNILGAKNLLPNGGTSKTINGVEFIVNEDGSVTANGTATGTSTIYFIYYTGNSASTYPLKEGKSYIVSGHPNDLSNGIRIQLEMNGSMVATSDLNGGLFTAPAFNNSFKVYIRIPTGETLNNKVFYPMIRPASIQDDTYAPYAMTNRELTKRLVYDEQQVTISGVPSKDWDNGTISYNIPSGYKLGSVTVKTSTGACIACISAITSTSIIVYVHNMGNSSTDVTVTAIILYIKDQP